MLKRFKMGNGSSQSIVLTPSRLQTSYSMHHNGYQYHRGGVPKYVHPQNRVLPKPVAGQRLRSTDNGSILQAAGTIRGQRRDSTGREENVDPEVMGILRRRSEMIEKEDDDCYRRHTILRNHRMFYSDPDIARRVSPDEYAVEEMADGYANRRSSGGGAASRASKLKYKKKQRAPDPPPSGSSLPRQMDRRAQGRNVEDRRNQKNSPCKCINKSKAPQPPSIVVHPPPPPPLPSAVTTRTKISSSPISKTPSGSSTRSSSITRAVECHDNKPSYEKNVHPLERWRNCRSSGDIRFDEQESVSASRTTVFDSKKVSDSQNKVPSYLPQKPDPFQKEIQAVTKKIAESRQEKPSPETKSQTAKDAPGKNASDSKQNRPNSPPKFYFADTGVFKKENTNYKADSSSNGPKLSVKATENGIKSSNDNHQKSQYRSHDSSKECTTIDEIVPSLQRFSPGRQRFKPSSRASTPTPQQKAEKAWEELSKNIYNNKQDDDSDIDIRLRPVLPRKPLELPKFSAAEAWQALGSDGLSSNQSTSDDGPELVTPYQKNVFPLSDTENRPRRPSEVPFGLYEKRNCNNGIKHRSMSDSHWTPRQDLLDDSDVSSDASEDAVVPRIRPNSGEISTRFSLPTVMFSNMRPIGSDIKSNGQQLYFGDSFKPKQAKKKAAKPLDSDHGIAPNFRKFLPKKNKYVSEEDIAVSDSNWTFGQYGLQKRGKQYSSDLMLSDKKKNELMMKSNFSDFLGDILVSKANHMRSQMKSSDSGNSNFSFYSTEGQIMYLPEKGGFVQENECSPPTRGRVYDIRRRFDPNLENPKPNNWQKSSKKKPSPIDIDLGRKRDLELAKMLEDEVRKRRNKEKITIRQQLQKMKNLNTDEEDDDFDDEAYFTEPKSREESQSPFFQPGPSNRFPGPEFGYKPFRFSRLGAVTTTDSSRLSHWQSSPALLEDSVAKNAMRPVMKGHFSSSSVMSSPDPESWTQPTGIVDSWLQRQRNLEFSKKHLGSVPILEQSADERLPITVADNANDGDVSSSPTPAPQKKKERRKTNIYKQLMDIVRKEEKHLRNAQRGTSEQDSRESSYSHRESSPSTSSEASSTSSYSYSDSSGSKNHGKNGVPANKEFHTSGYANSGQNNAASSFQVAFVQPYTPSKSYRPVPFEVNTTNGYRMPGLQEENKEVKAEAS